jgi:hypothetical protein
MTSSLKSGVSGSAMLCCWDRPVGVAEKAGLALMLAGLMLAVVEALRPGLNWTHTDTSSTWRVRVTMPVNRGNLVAASGQLSSLSQKNSGLWGYHQRRLRNRFSTTSAVIIGVHRATQPLSLSCLQFYRAPLRLNHSR